MISGTILKERYQIEDVIGSGGFATTYRGIDLNTQETIAIKECKNLRPKDIEKIRQEAQVMRELSGCDGIVNIRDYVELEESAYIMMDYVEGKTLKEYVEHGTPMNMDRAIGLLKPVMESVCKVHEKGLLHRDISPDNLMLRPDGTLKLLDFGAAKNVTEEDDEKTMTMVLKPGYAPEEQYRSISAQGTWTDVYALCATLYFCITGFAPTDSLQRMYEDTLRNPSELGASIKPYQEETLMHGLALRSENRIATVQELLSLFDKKAAGSKQFNTTKESTTGTTDSRQTTASGNHNYDRSVISDNTDRQNTVSGANSGNGTNRRVEPKMKSGLKLSGAVAVGLIAVILIALIGVVIFIGNRDTDSDDSLDDVYLYITDQTITENDVEAYRKNDELLTISFSNCILTDEIIEGLSEVTQMETISFSDCTGFSDLEPLAGMERLYSINYYVYDDAEPFDGAKIFPTEFPYITDLTLSLNTLDQGGEFFLHFPSLQSLYVDAAWNEDEATIPLDNLDFVKSMEGLDSLHLQDIEVLSDDISVLGECEQLYSLQLEHAGLTNLDGLEKCTNLSYLEVMENEITSLLPLAEHTQLRDLDVSYNHLQSFEGLENADSLSYLYAAGNEITDISVLEDKIEMTTLDLSENQLQSLSSCEKMIDLTELNANQNQIADLDGIVNSTSLTTLRVKDNQIESLEPLRDRFTELRILDVAGNKITDISMLSGCTGLQAFRADRNQLSSLSGLEGMTELYGVSACENQLTDITALGGLPQLYYVDLAHNQIKDISPLQALVMDDTVLYLEDNEISDISMLPVEHTYRSMSLYGNPLENYDTVKKLLVQTIYLQAIEGNAHEELVDTHIDYLKLVDVELSKQAQMKRFFSDSEIYAEFLSIEEAEESMQSTRDMLDI